MNRLSVINKVIAKLAKSFPKFKDSPIDEKIKRLEDLPYHKGSYYHVTPTKNYSKIVSQGLKGYDIWVSKDKPIDDYASGILVELNLEGIELKPDDRWKKSHQVFVALKPIPSSRIVRIFDYLKEVDMREDVLAKMTHTKSSEDIKKFIEEENI